MPTIEELTARVEALERVVLHRQAEDQRRLILATAAPEVRAKLAGVTFAPGQRVQLRDVLAQVGLPHSRLYANAAAQVMRERGASSRKSGSVRWFVLPA